MVAAPGTPPIQVQRLQVEPRGAINSCVRLRTNGHGDPPSSRDRWNEPLGAREGMPLTTGGPGGLRGVETSQDAVSGAPEARGAERRQRTPGWALSPTLRPWGCSFAL